MRKFQYALRIECNKAFQNKFFFIALLAGLLFGLMSALYSIEGYHEARDALALMGGNQMVQAVGLYNSWIGGEINSLGYLLFFTFLPILAALPYGWSYQEERKAGYSRTVEIRTGRFQYLAAKYLAVFLSGGSCIVTPLIGNFILTACFVPAVKPTILYELYYPMHYGVIASELFFEHPFVFVVMYWCIDFLFGGLFAVLSMAIGCFSQKRITVLAGPFILMLILHYVRTIFLGITYKELSPLYFLHATSIENCADAGVILVEGILGFAVTCGVIFGGERKRENI